jgi:ribonuclease P protein component
LVENKMSIATKRYRIKRSILELMRTNFVEVGSFDVEEVVNSERVGNE